MALPIPEKSKAQSKASPTLITFAIGFWLLILSGVFAGLVYTVGTGNVKKKNAEVVRQEAYRELLPALELVDRGQVGNREEILLQALDIIDKKVLKIDPKHPLGIQTKDEIQSELAEMKSARISNQERTITDQVRNLEQASREIRRLEDQVRKLESERQNLQRQNGNLNRQNGQLQQQMNQARSQVRNLENQLRQARKDQGDNGSGNSNGNGNGQQKLFERIAR